MESLLNRRTVRKYTGEDISDKMLDEILVEGARSSTTGNMQVYSIIVTRDPAMKKHLLPLHFNQKMVTEAPVMLTFCADFNRFSKWCRLRKAEPGYDNFLSFVTAAIDAVIVAQTVCIAAESRGLGICYLGTVTYMAHKISEALKLPAGVIPVAAVTMGWPAGKPVQPDRLPMDGIIHSEVYHDYSAADIDRIYREKESREDSKQFIAENHKETLAQVFTDVRYKKDDNIYFSKTLLKLLQDQGFMNNS